MSDARFVVGIDLGTTNCAVAYVDTAAAPRQDQDAPEIVPLALPQVVAAGEVDLLPTLPSFLLLPGPHDVKPGALALPWRDDPGFAVGAFARDRGAELPLRLVASAKSWLCNAEVDLTEPILPWRSKAAKDEDGDADGERVSPVEAASRYLAHVRSAWDAAFPDAPLAEQDVLITVPASFDAVATDLTARAAKHAGLEAITLLEEPQAAFYSWLAATGDGWRDRLAPGDVVLVCDVGGGTTDFSLIEVTDDGGSLALERIAVGDHILLGGDNMDLALAHLLATRLEQSGKALTAKQRAALTHACRRGKEELLSDETVASTKISILGGGSKLIGGTIRTELSRDDIESMVVGGFFPDASLDDVPRQRRRMGLGELGLPYAADAGITRHLAHFLARHGRAPTAILFNGGVMQATKLRGRVGKAVSGWYGKAAMPALSGTDLDLAVAHGAAYYGLVRRGKGIRIRGGTARAYYVGIETAMPAIPGFEPPVNGLCVAPFGIEEGSSVELPGEAFALVVGEPAEFRFFASSSRADDAAGAVIEADRGDVVELAPIKTVLEAGADHAAGERVAVTLSANVTEMGNLELWCVARDGSGRWKLEYSVRGDD